MGMFDNIRCEMDFPVAGIGKRVTIYFKDLLYQTKDLDQLLEYYRIDQRGGLCKDDKLVQHTGLVNFYTHIDNNIKRIDADKFEILSDWWVEFKANFVDGVCGEIETVEIKFRDFPDGSGRFKLV